MAISDDDQKRATLTGYAVMKAGIRHAMDQLQRQYADIEQQEALLQAPVPGVRRIGRPPKTVREVVLDRNVALAKTGWPADPEERKIENRRRRALWAQNQKPKADPEKTRQKMR